MGKKGLCSQAAILWTRLAYEKGMRLIMNRKMKALNSLKITGLLDCPSSGMLKN
jgi:hypothetical protein